jgi:hypothetical protein
MLSVIALLWLCISERTTAVAPMKDKKKNHTKYINILRDTVLRKPN